MYRCFNCIFLVFISFKSLNIQKENKKIYVLSLSRLETLLRTFISQDFK
jgi:hypothetical protein